ncbi:ZinT/AdcA family metal-binding protein [Oceanotoga teriensis]|jgi:Zn/Cd-binding protein ZinT|uniref:ZinT/AdcA family metal-binding protein n=1 Tax=Oceanotoga teriensis TaxID=515440 RepID=UPI002713398C|nr:ZinT/AdcA family metal-binding protein [Oceanotoga teriensis]MDO7977809.1 metal-binding protein ZinT [Oceanotoga teriensis]
MKKVLSVFLLSLFIFSSMLAFAESSPKVSDLTPWKGLNLDMGNIYNNKYADKLYEAVSKHKKGYSPEMVKEFYIKNYTTDIKSLEVLDGNNILINESYKISYNYIGKLETNWGDYDIEWFIFTTEDPKAEEINLKTLLLVPYHQHGNGLKHFHARFGNTSFAYLSTDKYLNNWWPTFYDPSVTNIERIIDDMLKNARMSASMLPDIK